MSSCANNPDDDDPSNIGLCRFSLDSSAALFVQENRATISSFSEVIQNVFAVCSTSGREVSLSCIVESWAAILSDQRRENQKFGHLVNPLKLIPIGETTHSRLLGDLLNPEGTHGQGAVLLHAFLKRIDAFEPCAGEWSLAVESDNVDLILTRDNPRSVIIIENKSNWAVDQPSQLYRYWYWNIHRRYPCLDYSTEADRKSFQIVYLPPMVGKVPDGGSLKRPPDFPTELPLTLGEVGVVVKVCPFREHVAEWLSECERLIPPDNQRLKSYLQFYKELWK